jgi:hypothetical protein
MYCTPTIRLKARKPHQCTNCAEEIKAGDYYDRWASVDDGKMFTNKMHPECLQCLQDEAESGGFEYIPYSGERPKDMFTGILRQQVTMTYLSTFDKPEVHGTI